MLNLFSYQMSYLEFSGMVFNLASVWLVTKRRMITWPIGIVGATLFAFLFYDLRLYADFFEQLYYIGASFYGWMTWRNKETKSKELEIQSGSKVNNLAWLLLTLLLGSISALFLQRIHLLWPSLFSDLASYPWMDGITTVASFAAMLLMARGRIECWYYWIVINLLSIWLYAVKDVYFVSALYGLYLLLGLKGLVEWRTYQKVASSS